MKISIFYLTIASLIPVVASIVFYFLMKKTHFSKLGYYTKQSIIGIIFGMIAIIGTEWGIPVSGYGIDAMINCRDAAPLTAGLLFGSPAGIIAGFIGGIERWFSVYWGVGEYTRLACTLGTITAGLLGALLRKYMFENKKPTWQMALGCSMVIEVFHLTLVFVTNISDASKAIKVVQLCSLPMIIANGLSVMLSTLILGLLIKNNQDNTDDSFKNTLIHKKMSQKPIFKIIQNWLLSVVCICFVITSVFTYAIQTNLAYKSSEESLINTISEVSNDIEDASDSHMLMLTQMFKNKYEAGNVTLEELVKEYSFHEASIIDSNGIIIESTNSNFIGYDMKSGEQSAEFLVLLGDTESYVQKYGPISMTDTECRKFAGIKYRDGFIQTSYDAEKFQKDVESQISRIAVNRHINKTGVLVILDKAGKIISQTKDSNDFINSLKVNNITPGIKNTIYKASPSGVELYYSYSECEGYYIYALYPYDEATEIRDIAMFVFCYVLILIFAVLFLLIYMLVKRVIINQILEMTASLSRITNGDLDHVVSVNSNKEFASLSNDINTTVDTLKHYIAEAAARIDKELIFAKSIQESALPRSFPAFPNRKDLDIYATMNTAKEVGGDFYDYYFTDKDTMNFLIADVSGKGIPAAMFMMRAKSVLKGLAELNHPVDEVFFEANNALCSGNDAEMFVTAWQAQIDLKTGVTSFANAGHNAPVIKHKDGKFEYYSQKKNLVLGGIENIPYKRQEITLLPGDIVFLFTDGVTEATNTNVKLFGEDRLLEVLNAKEYDSIQDICHSVQKAIDDFVGDADQFDDITMVAFKYIGQ